MAGFNSIDDAMETMVAESRFTMSERPGVIWKNISKEPFLLHKGRTMTVPKYGLVNADFLTEGIDLTAAQEITDTAITITPAEYGAKVLVTDIEMATMRDDFMKTAGMLLGSAFDVLREQELCDDAANFSVTAGSAGTALNLGITMAMHASLKYNAPAAGTAGRGGEPAPDPILGFITPATAHSLKKTMVGGIGAAGATQVVPALDRANLSEEFEAGGVQIKTSINFNKDTSDDVVSIFMSKMAWIGVEFNGGPKAENQRDASLRGTELVFSGSWGVSEYNDAWGRAVTLDSALPTS